jgi:hypothetical protein
MDILSAIQELLPYQPESTLKYFINQAQQDFLNLSSLNEIPENANYIIIQMVLIYANRFGNEGIKSMSTGGVKYQFIDALPPELFLQIGNLTTLTW